MHFLLILIVAYRKHFFDILEWSPPAVIVYVQFFCLNNTRLKILHQILNYNFQLYHRCTCFCIGHDGSHTFAAVDRVVASYRCYPSKILKVICLDQILGPQAELLATLFIESKK